MMTDPIADMLTRIRNGGMAGHKKIEVPASNMKKALAGILKEHGYIEDFSVIDDKKQGILMIYLRYSAPKKSVISGLKRISKPGRRIYVDKTNIPKVLNGMGIAILSTSKGVITDRQARETGVGGEWLCSVW